MSVSVLTCDFWELFVSKCVFVFVQECVTLCEVCVSPNVALHRGLWNPLDVPQIQFYYLIILMIELNSVVIKMHV